MATLNASKWGYILSSNYSTHDGVRDATTGFSRAANPTNTVDAIAYRRFTGRGRGNSYQIRRAFYYFDTSGITGTVSGATLNIKGGGAGADVIVVGSTAFGGDGSSDLTTADYDNVLFGTHESNSFSFSSGQITTNNSITLLSGAMTKIQINDAFIVAVLQYDNDHQDTDPGSNTEQVNQIDYSTTGYLDYTETAAPSGPSNLTSLSGITKANIANVNTITLANISSINGVS
jgi:hypothetical protein